MDKQRSIIGSSIVPFRLVFIIWLVFFLTKVNPIGIFVPGIVPRSLIGLLGIITGPLVHGSYIHLLSNTIPILFLGAMLFFYYPRIARWVFLRAYFITNLLVWLFARGGSSHIGASGVVYALAFFLFFFGIFRRDTLSLIISVVVLLFYGTMVYGLLPSDPNVSYESHLFGAMVGTWSAYNFRSTQVE